MFARLLLALVIVGLLAVGLLQPVEQETVWLLCLWATVPLAGVLLWLSYPTVPRGVNRSVVVLGIAVTVGFLMISMQLLRQQVVRAGETYARVHIDPASGQVTANVRPVLAEQKVIRGTIYDRDNLALVSSQPATDGFVKRVYPVADQGYDPAAFSNVVGFYSRNYGQSGLEATYSDYLSGSVVNTWQSVQDSVLGRPQVGNSVHLTLDADLQAATYELLRGVRGSIVILDTRTGAVLAMASMPGYDPRGLSFDYAAPDWQVEEARVNAFWQEINSEAAGQPLVNRATQGQYPPGSTFKTVTAVAALEYPQAGQPNTIRCFNELPVESGAPPVVNAVPGLASLTGDPSDLERVYAYSCNVAFAQYALRLEQSRFTDVATRFGLVTPATIDAAPPQFPDLATAPSRLYVEGGFLSRPAALADTGYGQGQLLVTPLQMALVAQAVANSGAMMQPYIVERVDHADGRTLYRHQPRAVQQVMTGQTAAVMRQNMRAVAQYGFGSDISRYVNQPVGGKSGTGEHVPGATPHAWFIAIGPIEQPRYAVAVIIERGGEGSTVGARVAGQAMQLAFELVGAE